LTHHLNGVPFEVIHQLNGPEAHPMETVQRTVARVETKTHLGPSAQADDEIAQAVRDFHDGNFGGIPRQARLQYR
jgi:hypothetical protein